MCCLHIVGMVISPRPSHALRLDVIGHYLVVIREGLVADGALSALFGDLPVQQLAHLGWRPQFPISPGVMWIFFTLDTEPQSSFPLSLLATTAE